MRFRLVPKSATLNDLEWRNGCHFARAGISLRRALFRKKMWGPSPGGSRPYFSWKNWQPFLSLSVLQRHSYLFSPVKLATFFWSSLSLLFILLVHSSVAHYFRHAENCCFSCGAPVRPNMLNMLKSVAAFCTHGQTNSI